MLRRAIVPDSDIAGLPAPADRVFRPGDVILKNGNDMPRIRTVEAHKSLQVGPNEQRAFARLRVNSDYGVFSFNDSRPDSLQPFLFIFLFARQLSIVEQAAVNPPEIVRENFEGFRK